MTDGEDHLSEFTLHVVLATFPQTQERHFDNSVRSKFYQRYRESFKAYLSKKDDNYGIVNGVPVLYNPLSYFVLGNYDIAYVALIDNFKFAQRLFEPELSKDNKQKASLFPPHTFQSFTGISHHKAPWLKNFFYDHLKAEEKSRKLFLGICNLKLNNGFLIGNGKNYLSLVMQEIDKAMEGHPSAQYLKLQSFSWFEISLMIFSDDAQCIAAIIQTLRRLTVEDLLRASPDIIENSLYKAIYEKKGLDFFKYANVFADTHTYIGIHGDVFDPQSTYYDTLLPTQLELKTDIEWQIKPGHMHMLTNELKNNKILSEAFDETDKFFLAGRTDYQLKGHLTHLDEIIKLIRFIMAPGCRIFEHVRKMKTNVYFEGLPKRKHPKKKTINFHEQLMSLGEDTDQAALVNKQLKALKLSRQIRSKVLKIFSNYNNGIQDIVLFPYLLDFRIFIERLKTAIQAAYDSFLAKFDDPLAEDKQKKRINWKIS